MQTTKEAQELWCHHCAHYVQFELDLSLNGNHVLECPNCGHEHCRVVKDGLITDDRWDSRNGVTTMTTATSVTTYSMYDVSPSLTTGGNYFLFSAWMNTVTS